MRSWSSLGSMAVARSRVFLVGTFQNAGRIVRVSRRCSGVSPYHLGLMKEPDQACSKRAAISPPPTSRR